MSSHREGRVLYVAGFLALWIEVSYSFGAMSGGLSEPFPTVQAYLGEVLSVSMAVGICSLLPFAALAVLLVMFGKVTMFGPLAKSALIMFFPTIAWATLVVVDATNDRSVTIFEAVPSWMARPWIRLLGRFEWLYLLILVGVGIWVYLAWHESKGGRDLSGQVKESSPLPPT